ncbi:MAG TPA: PAS domain S-box protein [Syntrophales bacterium]|nr:PAS domain S-box protein [Syntrophales bacterium]
MKIVESEKSESKDKDNQGALQDLLFAVLDAMPHAVLGLKDRLIISANHAVETVFGWKPEELVGQSTRVLYRTDEEFEEIAKRFYPALEQRRTFFDEFPCRHKDGRDIVCMVGASRVGELLKERMIVATYEDITARKRAEEELREYRGYLEKLVDVRTNDLKKANELLKHEIIEREQAEELYKTLAEKSITAVFIIQDRKFRFINTTAISYAGYTPEELIGKDSMILVHPEDREAVKKKASEMLRGKDTTPYEYRIVNKQGQVRWIMQTITSIQYEGKRAILGNAMDISDRKRAEEEQHRREKLQSVLEIAGTVCHEMNQPMQIIAGYSELLLMKTSENDPIYKKLSAITEQIRRMSTITRKLMMIKDYKTQDYIGFSRIIDIHDDSDIDSEGSEKKL